MNRRPIKTVVNFEVIRQLKKPSFWIALLLLPLLLLGLFGLSMLSSSKTEEAMLANDAVKEKVVGIVDQPNIINPEILNSKDLPEKIGSAKEVKIIAEKEQGIEEVKDGKIDILYVIPEKFSEEKKAEVYSQEANSSLFSTNENPLRNILSMSAASQTSVDNAVILSKSYTVSSITFDKNGNTVNLLGKAVIPLAILALFYVLICVFGNRMLMAVVEEKENRISEMILTSISARHLIIGKIIAMILLGLLQMVIFVVPLIAMLIINRDNPMVASVLSSIEWNPITILMNVALLLLSYFLYAGASTLIGALCPNARDASQYIGIVILGVMSPLMFIQDFIGANPSMITYIFSYFPLSAPIAMMMRNAFGTLPTWEFVLGIVELAVCSYFVVKLTVKTFQKNAINFSSMKISFKKRSWK